MSVCLTGLQQCHLAYLVPAWVYLHDLLFARSYVNTDYTKVGVAYPVPNRGRHLLCRVFTSNTLT